MYIRPVFIILGTMMAVGAVAWGIRKLVPLEYLRHHHEVAFPIFLQIGVIYAVVLAFLFSLEWDNFKSARQEADAEAVSLIILMHLVEGYPAPVRQVIDQKIMAYTKAIIQFEWPKMLKKQEDTKAEIVLNTLWQSFLAFTPGTQQENSLQQQSLSLLQKLTEYRQMRIFMATAVVPVRLWEVLIGLGGLVVSVSFLFGMRYIWSQTILIASLAGMIAVLITFILIMSAPLSGHFQLPPQAFQEALIKMQIFTQIDRNQLRQ